MEVISVLADYQESSSTLPKDLKVKFYLPEATQAYLTVRELEYKTYYWLDRVKPSEPWRTGFGNHFTWPTEPVLQELAPDIDMYDLGALVRLGHQNPSSIERVAPVILYHSIPPSKITGYRFTLKPPADARIHCEVRQKPSDELHLSRTFRRKPGEESFSLSWDATRAAPGPYIFEVSGFYLDTGDRISQTIHFHHRPTVK